uniref:CUB domain-containing protein n=1 Tax=Echinostoma caproni TaxID=27848 RepID=A0A183A575_9TREM
LTHVCVQLNFICDCRLVLITYPYLFLIATAILYPVIGCFFEFNRSQSVRGNFSSPNYPGLYPIDLICEYRFSGNNVRKIEIEFLAFDVESVPSISHPPTGTRTVLCIYAHTRFSLTPRYQLFFAEIALSDKNQMFTSGKVRSRFGSRWFSQVYCLNQKKLIQRKCIIS